MFLPSHDLRRLTPSISAAVDNFLRSRALGRKMEDPEELALFCASSPLPPLPEQIETDSDLFPIFFPKLAKQRSDRSELLPTTLLSTTSPPRQTSSTSTRTRPGNRNVPSLPSLLATWPRLQPSLVKPLLRYLESVVDQESFCLQEMRILTSPLPLPLSSIPDPTLHFLLPYKAGKSRYGYPLGSVTCLQ